VENNASTAVISKFWGVALLRFSVTLEALIAGEDELCQFGF